MIQANELTLSKILKHHLSGGKFEYKSFDFKKAVEEFEKTEAFEKLDNSWPFFNNPYKLEKYDIPEYIREKYSFWRHGKVRSIEFNPNGSIYRIKIGARYAITIYEYNVKNLVRIIK